VIHPSCLELYHWLSQSLEHLQILIIPLPSPQLGLMCLVNYFAFIEVVISICSCFGATRLFMNFCTAFRGKSCESVCHDAFVALTNLSVVIAYTSNGLCCSQLTQNPTNSGLCRSWLTHKPCVYQNMQTGGRVTLLKALCPYLQSHAIHPIFSPRFILAEFQVPNDMYLRPNWEEVFIFIYILSCLIGIRSLVLYKDVLFSIL